MAFWFSHKKSLFHKKFVEKVSFLPSYPQSILSEGATVAHFLSMNVFLTTSPSNPIISPRKIFISQKSSKLAKIQISLLKTFKSRKRSSSSAGDCTSAGDERPRERHQIHARSLPSLVTNKFRNIVIWNLLKQINLNAVGRDSWQVWKCHKRQSQVLSFCIC